MKCLLRILFYIFTFIIIFLYSALSIQADIVSSLSQKDNWYLEDIEAAKAMEYLSSLQPDTTEPVIVAVIDTGTDYTHPLIQNALWINYAELNGTEGLDDDGNGYVDDIYGIDTFHDTANPMDDSTGSIKGHGTHVAGSILITAGVTTQQNPFQIRLMLIKAGDAYGNFNHEDVEEALYYAADNGASVINLSLSSFKFPSSLQEALSYASQSAVIVASAGNKGLSTSDSGYPDSTDFYPAGCPDVLGVMSYDSSHSLSYFSNWDFQKYSGAEYEIAAPGEGIYSCYYDGKYKSMKGTSMSTGIVSGCAALLCVKYRSVPEYSAADLTSLLMGYSKDSVTYCDTYGTVHDFLKLNLYQLLTTEPKPLIKTANQSFCVSGKNTATLSYTLLNRGCGADSIRTEITWHTSCGQSASLQAETPAYMNALENAACSITFPLPENLKENEPIILKINTTCKNASLSTDKHIYSFSSTLQAYTGEIPADKDAVIPLSGITVSASSNLLRPGETASLAINFIPENTTDDRTLTFASSHPQVAAIDTSGNIKALSSGKTDISITTSTGMVRSIPITVYEPQPPKTAIDKLPVTLSQNRFQWNGKIQKPSVSIKGLKKDRDYTLRYVTPKSKNIGKYRLIIEGIGNYTGTIRKSYQICIVKNSRYDSNGITYQITSKTSASCKTSGTASVIGTHRKKAAKLTVPHKIVIGGKTYYITSIHKNAFRKHTSLTSITIGKYVTRIGSYAFDGDIRLRRINIKSKKITYIGKHAFRNIHKKAYFHVSDKSTADTDLRIFP